MKIIFLCGCLEPGRDGVGDYVRRLAVELQQQGHRPQVVALNDYYVTAEETGTQQTPQGDLLTLRLPATWEMGVRFARAKVWIDDFNPEWLSLQFVPYAFHTRGAPFQLGKYLLQVGKNRHWHVMIHELWIGMNTNASMQHVWWAKVQRFVIKRLINQLRPKIIHTHTALYEAHLTKLGFTSQYLPLFSNIPSLTLPAASSSIVGSSFPPSSKDVSLVLFGFIHPGSPVELLAQDAAEFANRYKVLVTLTMIGRCGSEQDRWAKNWTALGLPVKIMGEQSPSIISKVLLDASLGIVTTPALLLGKSGTAAAMREHGLPVLCVSAPWHARGVHDLLGELDAQVYQAGRFESYLAVKPAEIIIKLPDIAKQLSESLLASIYTWRV